MAYFIEQGAEVEKGNPLAYALSERIRTALGIFKKYEKRFSTFGEQVNIALRHHASEGNLKWVSLMLWAGGDPYAPGPSEYNEEDVDEEPLSALGLAALCGHTQIFKLKAIRLDPKHPVMKEVMRYAHRDRDGELMRELIKMGVMVNDQENGGSGPLNRLLTSMGESSFNPWSFEMERKNLDTEEARETLKTIHLLTKNGARWIPRDKDEVHWARKSLLKLIPDYTVEFIWIMAKYKACSLEHIQDLIRTPAIKGHIKSHSARVEELLAGWG